MAKRAGTTRTSGRTLHVLRVTLEGIEPPIWRLVRVRSEAKLGQLHGVLQAAMGWTNSHLHQFHVGDHVYSDIRFEVEYAEDEFEVAIRDALPGKGATLQYEYDFGDGWLHQVSVEDIVDAAARSPRAVCIDGERACPPEDVGGPLGYEEFLDALADARHERHEELRDWITERRAEYAEFDSRYDGPFDPEAFRITAASRMIRQLTKGKRWEWVLDDEYWAF